MVAREERICMLLAIDVGNSNIVLGTLVGGKVTRHWRVATDPQRTEDEYGVLFQGLLRNSDVVPADITATAIASVVPPLTTVLHTAVERYLRCPVLTLSRHHIPDIPLRVDHPESVGIDRLANIVGALDGGPGPLVVVDFGTATTFDAVSHDGAFLGGAIAPGLGIAADALFSRTSSLPRIAVAPPSTAIGTNTVTNMQSGLVFGYAGLVDGLVRRFERELQGCCRVYATGGFASVVAAASETITEVDPWLTLRGISLIYDRQHSRAR